MKAWAYIHARAACIFTYPRNSGIWRLWMSYEVRALAPSSSHSAAGKHGGARLRVVTDTIDRRGTGNTGNLREAGRRGIVMVSWKTASTMLAAGGPWLLATDNKPSSRTIMPSDAILGRLRQLNENTVTQRWLGNVHSNVDCRSYSSSSWIFWNKSY